MKIFGPEGYDFVTQHQVMVRDTGHWGILYGGVMLQWLDEAGAMYAEEVTRADKLVTKALDAMEFITSARVGENCRFFARVAHRGTTSVRIHIKAFVHDARKPQGVGRPITEVTMTFVSVDNLGIKTAIHWPA